MDIRNIVFCTPEQLETLHREGQVVIDGVVRKKENGVLYSPGELPLLEWFNKVMEVQHKQYEVSHTPLTIKSLEQEYEEITDIFTGKQSKNFSAVGYTAILKNGDTIKVTSPNFGAFYINGETVDTDYTYSGSGYEVVNVWAFESKSGDLIVPPALTDTPTFIINKLNIKNIGQKPIVNDSYISYANEIELDNFVLSAAPLTTKVMKDMGKYNFNQVVGNFVTEYTDESTTIDSDKLAGKPQLEKINFPNLEVISMKTSDYSIKPFLWGCSNPELEIIFPKLKQILTNEYATISYQNAHPFGEVYRVVLPESVEVIQKGACINNSEIHLNCKNAASIDNNWCNTTPTVNFTMCKDWGASINIAIAAKNHNKEWFIDLFTNCLKDFSALEDSGDGGFILYDREITIPKTIFDILTEEELAIAEDKNWTVGGA